MGGKIIKADQSKQDERVVELNDMFWKWTTDANKTAYMIVMKNLFCVAAPWEDACKRVMFDYFPVISMVFSRFSQGFRRYHTCYYAIMCDSTCSILFLYELAKKTALPTFAAAITSLEVFPLHSAPNFSLHCRFARGTRHHS